ncbi:MAG: hypothetical protein WCE73_10945 [Candidatus Angelobacter sp.]
MPHKFRVRDSTSFVHIASREADLRAERLASSAEGQFQSGTTL